MEAAEGCTEGAAAGIAEGSVEGPAEGSAAGTTEGSVEGPAEGSAAGSAAGSRPEGFAVRRAGSAGGRCAGLEAEPPFEDLDAWPPVAVAPPWRVAGTVGSGAAPACTASWATRQSSQRTRAAQVGSEAGVPGVSVVRR